MKAHAWKVCIRETVSRVRIPLSPPARSPRVPQAAPMNTPLQLKCPPNMVPHIRKLFEGEYDVPYNKERPVILDIGANIGGFAAWATQRWKIALVTVRIVAVPIPCAFARER